ncbi:BPI/LBP family protein [Pyrus ussuriensis x Pyrus communis]|uniref:BPI/LBP family protein n=1 Tax=Pyrus ussuriensis x Pyrus communis TaxID=2448454 RepID=A0A5N5I3V6_9ROSA|nr:BPI/LBP family protein [Pyrus ussuriensis x Pyrus communis]
MVLSNVTIYEIDVGPLRFELGDDGITVIDSGVTCNLNMNWHYSYSTWSAPVVVLDELNFPKSHLTESVLPKHETAAREKPAASELVAAAASKMKKFEGFAEKFDG